MLCKRIVLPIALLVVLSACDKKDATPDYTNNIGGTTWEGTLKAGTPALPVETLYSWVFTDATSGQLAISTASSNVKIDFTYTYSGGKGTITIKLQIGTGAPTTSMIPFSIAGDTLTLDSSTLKTVVFKRK